MSLTPNIQLFANNSDSSNEQNVLIRCTEEVYKILRKSNQVSDDCLYFATYDKTPSSNMFISDHLYMGKKLIGNSGVIFIEATNGYATVNNIQVDLTTPTNLTSAITGVPGQVLFVVNHSIDELNNKDQYNTFVYLWKPIYDSKNESNTDSGEWINANINCTLDGIDIDGLGVAKLNLDNILPEEPKIDTLYVVSSDSNKPINAINKSLYIYDPDTQSWVSLMGGVGRDSVDADCSHKFNDYDNNYVSGNYSNSFNELNGVSGEASNGMGYKTHTTESAALTTGIRNYNYSTAGLVSGINNTVGINYTYVSHYYADDSTSTYYLYLNNKYNNLSEINVINFKLNSPIIFTSDLDRQDNILDLSDESFNNLYVCRITDYHQNYNLLIVDKIPDVLKNNFTEYVDAEGNNTKNFYINEGCICKFFQPNNSAGCSIPSSLNNLDSDDVIHPGSANVVGGSNNVVQATNTIVVGKNLYASNNDAAYFGKYNKDEPNSAFLIGSGTSSSDRSNSVVVTKDGKVKFNAADTNQVNGMYSTAFGTDVISDGFDSFIAGNGNYRDITKYSYTAIVKSIDIANKIINIEAPIGLLIFSPGYIIKINNLTFMVTDFSTKTKISGTNIDDSIALFNVHVDADVSSLNENDRVVGYYLGVARGSVSAVFGSENIAGEGSLVSGIGNSVPGSVNIVGGYSNDVIGDYDIVGGYGNVITNDRCLAFGSANAAFSWASGVGGYDCSTGLLRTYSIKSIDETNYKIKLGTVTGLYVNQMVQAQHHGASSYGSQNVFSQLGKIIDIDANTNTITLDGFNYSTACSSNAKLDTTYVLYTNYNYGASYLYSSYGDSTEQSRLQWASGLNSNAPGGGAFTHGYSNLSLGGQSVTLGGYKNTVYADNSFIAGGENNNIYLYDSFIGAGFNNLLKASNSAIFGSHNIVDNNVKHVFELGEGLTTSTGYMTLLGSYNTSINNAKFVIGNGLDSDNRNNAFVVYNDGSASIDKQSTANNAIVRYDTLTSVSNNMNNKYDSLELRVAELEYNPIDIVTFKFNNNSSYTGEVGGTLSGGFNLNWSFNTTNYLNSLVLTSSKAILNGSSSVTLSLSNTDYSVSTDLNLGTTIGSTSITLKAIDNRNATDSATVYIYCYNKIYWGASTIPNVYNSSFILGLSSTLANSVAKTVNITTGNNQYMYYCVPTRLGKCAFKVGGFDGGFEEPQTISFTNTNGYTENYYIYRSTNSNLGTQSVVVSKGA